MNIKRVPISEVEAWAKNPRNIKTKDYERLKKQILELGIYKPLLCVRENGRYITLGGNMRLRALQELEHKEVDISIVVAKDEATKIKFALSDNDRAGEYDDLKLAELTYPHIEDINLEDYKIDLGAAITMTEVMERFGPDRAEKLEDPGAIARIPKDAKDLIKKYENVHVEFSGGKDSLLALLWTRKICKELKKSFTVLFVETGGELPDLSSYINRLCQDLKVNLVRMNSRANLVEYYTKRGRWPDPLFRDCQHKFINEILDSFDPEGLPKTIKIRGGRADQKVGRSVRTAFLKLKNGASIFAPFYETSQTSYETMLRKIKKLVWPGYAKGFLRTACWCCPFQRPEQYEALKENYPMVWEEMRILTSRLIYPAHKTDSNIKRFHRYWDPYNEGSRPKRRASR